MACGLSLIYRFGTWDLGFEIRDLGFGIWDLRVLDLVVIRRKMDIPLALLVGSFVFSIEWGDYEFTTTVKVSSTARLVPLI